MSEPLTPEQHIAVWHMILELHEPEITVQQIVEARRVKYLDNGVDDVNTDQGKKILLEIYDRSYFGLLYEKLGLFPPADNYSVNYADSEEVDVAYKTLARSFGPNITAKFQQIHQAYKLLKDELNGHVGVDNGGDELKLITYTSHWHSVNDDPVPAVPKILIKSSDSMDWESGEANERPHKRPHIGSES